MKIYSYDERISLKYSTESFILRTKLFCIVGLGKNLPVVAMQEQGGDVACLLIEDVGDVGLWPVFIVVELQACLYLTQFSNRYYKNPETFF